MCLFVAFLLPSYLCKTSHSGVSFGIVLFSFQRSSRLAATCLSYQSIFALSRQAVKLLKTLSRWPCRSQHVFLATIKILASLLIPVKKKIVIFDARNIKIGTDFPCRFNRQMITVSRTETSFIHWRYEYFCILSDYYFLFPSCLHLALLEALYLTSYNL